MRSARGSPKAEPGTQATPLVSSSTEQKSTTLAIFTPLCDLPKAQLMSGNTENAPGGIGQLTPGMALMVATTIARMGWNTAHIPGGTSFRPGIAATPAAVTHA